MLGYEAARRDAELLRDAIKALEAAEFARELTYVERAKLTACKSALEHALLRLAIRLVESTSLGN